MNSFYVDINKCRPAEGDLASCQNDLNSASRQLNVAGDGLKAMGGTLASVGASAENLAIRASLEAKEVAQLSQALHNILNHYYVQEAGLIGQNAISGIQNVINTVGETAQDGIQDLATIISGGSESIAEYIGSGIYSTVRRFGEAVGEFSQTELGQYFMSYLQQINNNIDEDFGGIRDLTSGLWEMVLVEDGRYVEYVIDLIQGNEIRPDYYDFLKPNQEFDLGEFMKDELIPDFDTNHSSLGNILRWGGRVLDGLDYASVVGEDFMDVIYNEETQQCEWTMQNVGYFISDSAVDLSATFACNFAGDITGKLAGTAATAIPVVGPFVAPFVDFGVSTIVSTSAEFLINFDLPIDLNGDGEFDSVLDMTKMVHRQSVDNIIAIGEYVGETVYDYMATNHPELTQAISDTMSPIIDAGGEVFEYAAEQFDNHLNMVLDVSESVEGIISEAGEGAIDFAADVFESNFEHRIVGNIENTRDFVEGVMDGNGLEATGEFIVESFENEFEYAEEFYGSMAEEMQEFAYDAGEYVGEAFESVVEYSSEIWDDKVEFFGDCLSALGLG